MTVLVPLQAVPDQTCQVTLGGQNCTVRVYQKTTGLYVDLYVNNAVVLTGVSALNMNKIVRDAYHGFTGDLYFYDTQGNDDPSYAGLGARFVLLYG